MLFFILLALAIKFDTLNADKELQFLQIIFRHGDRAPIWKYATDPNGDYAWPEGHEKLTKLGMKMHYMLGKHIRSMYKDFITSNPNEVRVNSSEVDRCIRSAQSHLAGLYEPDLNWKFHESVHWQPIPVIYTPQEKMINMAYPCPRADEEVKNIKYSFSKEQEQKHNQMFAELTKLSGSNIDSYTDAFLLFDTLFAEKAHGLIIPDWVEKYWEDLEEINDRLFYDMYNSSIYRRLRSGPFVEKLADMMTNKIDGNLNEQKVQIYSTHDSILALLLATLEISNSKRPPYAATLLVELHKDENEKSFVRFLYLNSTTPQAGQQDSHVFYLHGCEEFCPLEYFIEFIRKKNLIPDNLAEECGNKNLKAMGCAEENEENKFFFNFFLNLL